MTRLRDQLKEKLQASGTNVKDTFAQFDRNGDGVFSPMEFEMIFTILNIDFTKDDLRKLIMLTDTNRDGRIDAKEFHNMLYKEDLQAAQAALDDEDV